MNPDSVRGESVRETFIEEGCLIGELWNTAEAPSLSVAKAGVAPRTRALWHRPDVDQRYLVAAGGGTMELAGREPAG